MMLVAFRSKLTGAAGDDYARMAAAMEALARSFPGFVDFKDYRAGDGERLTLVWWQDAETLQAWAADARHRVAQATGRERWYEYYKMDVAEITRVSHFERTPETVT
jgi:heme-degrading monooxygenase HmoA